jgi:hypothetical protein
MTKPINLLTDDELDARIQELITRLKESGDFDDPQLEARIKALQAKQVNEREDDEGHFG